MSNNYHLDCKVEFELLKSKIFSLVTKYVDTASEAEIITKLILRAEKMNVPTHGLHYFVHSVYPHLLKGYQPFKIKKKNNFIYSNGHGGIGFYNLHRCLLDAEKLSSDNGISLIQIKNPGKIGALRVFAVDLIRKGKLVILLKNTASTQGFLNSDALIGTNPICIGFPDSKFIFDSSTSTVCTNGLRLMNKQEKTFKDNVGWDKNGQMIKNPNILLEEGSYLSSFSTGSFWYKSFFLGFAIECLAALAGAKTGSRVGEKKGSRLHSQEGLIGIVIDKSVFPYYDDYKEEIKLLIKEIESKGAHIPGDFNSKVKYINVSKKDWEFINSICES